MSTRTANRFGLLLAPVFLALAAGLAGYFTQAESGGSSVAPDSSEAVSVALGGSVQSASPDEIVVRVGNAQRSFTLDPSTVVERVGVIEAADIEVGQWLNAGAIAQDQTILTVVGIVIIPAEMLAE